MRLTVITATLTCLAGIANAAAEPMAVQGVGARSCAEFAKDYKSEPRSMGLFYFSWAQGFMSGWNIGTAVGSGDKSHPVRDLSSRTTEQMERHMRDYCDEHPLRTFLEAVTNLYVSLPLTGQR